MTSPELIRTAAQALSNAFKTQPIAPKAFVGFDGFIDEIVQVVDQREDFETYTPVRTIKAYAERLAAAAGKSTNVELVVHQIKMGGNGPLMSDALGRLGTQVRYVGAVGHPVLNPVFASLEDHGEVVGIADAAVTIAAEFDDGKIMHGKLETLNEITYENIVKRVGGESNFDDFLRGADIVALVNWTMIPHLTSVWREIVKRLLAIGDAGPRYFFFDLCDPQKRPKEDLREAIEVIATFDRAKATPILGLNEKESFEVCEAFGVEYGTEDHAGMLARIERLREKTGIPEIVVHPRTCAAAVGNDGSGSIDGPLCANPKLTTGAGDHFNGGYCFGRLMGLSPQDSLVVGKAVSGYYVRQGRGPHQDEILRFCEKWAAGKLDPWTDD